MLKISDSERTERPFIVVLNKADVWLPMLGDKKLQRVVEPTNLGVSCINLTEIERQSELMRGLLQAYVPEVCFAAESFARQVYYVPVSALGSAPSFDADGKASIRPAAIKPWNVMTPFLLGLNLASNGYVARYRVEAEREAEKVSEDRELGVLEAD
jgi:hypothetical protein